MQYLRTAINNYQIIFNAFNHHQNSSWNQKVWKSTNRQTELEMDEVILGEWACKEGGLQ